MAFPGIPAGWASLPGVGAAAGTGRAKKGAKRPGPSMAPPVGIPTSPAAMGLPVPAPGSLSPMDAPAPTPPPMGTIPRFS